MDNFENVNKEIQDFLTTKSVYPLIEERKEMKQENDLIHVLNSLHYTYNEINNSLKHNNTQGIKDSILRNDIKMNMVNESLLETLRQAVSDKNGLIDQNQDLNKTKLELEQQLSRSKMYAKKLESEIEQRRSSTDEMNRLMQDQRQKLCDAQTEVQRSKGEANIYRVKVEELETMRRRAADRFGSYEKEMSTLTKIASEREEKINAILKEKREEENRNSGIKIKIAELERQAEESQRKLEMKEKNLSLCNEELSKLLNENKKYSAENEKFRNNSIYYEGLYKNLNEQNAYLNSQLNKIIQSENYNKEGIDIVEMYTKKIKKVKRKNKKIQGQMKKISDENAELKEKLEDDLYKLNSKDDTVILQGKIEDLIKLNKEYKEKIKELGDDKKNSNDTKRGVTSHFQKPSLNLYNQEPSLNSYNQKPSLNPYNQKPSLNSYNQKPSLNSYNQKPSLNSYNQKPSLNPYNQKPSLNPYNQKPSLNSYNQKPSLNGFNIRPTVNDNNNPSLNSFNIRPTVNDNNNPSLNGFNIRPTVNDYNTPNIYKPSINNYNHPSVNNNFRSTMENYTEPTKATYAVNEEKINSSIYRSMALENDYQDLTKKDFENVPGGFSTAGFEPRKNVDQLSGRNIDQSSGRKNVESSGRNIDQSSGRNIDQSSGRNIDQPGFKIFNNGNQYTNTYNNEYNNEYNNDNNEYTERIFTGIEKDQITEKLAKLGSIANMAKESKTNPNEYKNMKSVGQSIFDVGSTETVKTFQTSSTLKEMMARTEMLKKKFESLENELGEIKDGKTDERLMEQMKMYNNYYSDLNVDNDSDIL